MTNPKMLPNTELEDLSIRARRGDLTEDERRAFERATSLYPELRLIHRMGQDFDQELRVRPGDDEIIRRTSARALALSNAPRSKRIKTAALRLLLAAFVTSATAGAAFWLNAGRVRERGAVVLPEAKRLDKLIPQARPSVVPIRSDHDSPSPIDPVASEGSVLVADGSAKLTPPASQRVPEAVPSSEANLRAPEVRLSDANLRATEAVPSSEANLRATAADLFRSANEARRRGNMHQVEVRYGELQARFPDSNEARISRVSLGKLLLLARRASEAEHQFGLYLSKGGGALDEEALAGRADAFSQLGQRDAERRAWQDLLRRHGSSVYATRATERLRSLGAAGN